MILTNLVGADCRPSAAGSELLSDATALQSWEESHRRAQAEVDRYNTEIRDLEPSLHQLRKEVQRNRHDSLKAVSKPLLAGTVACVALSSGSEWALLATGAVATLIAVREGVKAFDHLVARRGEREERLSELTDDVGRLMALHGQRASAQFTVQHCAGLAQEARAKCQSELEALGQGPQAGIQECSKYVLLGSVFLRKRAT